MIAGRLTVLRGLLPLWLSLIIGTGGSPFVSATFNATPSALNSCVRNRSRSSGKRPTTGPSTSNPFFRTQQLAFDILDEP